MRAVRICLLVLLAVLLPVRGAVAAAMLCPAAGMGGHGERVVHQHAEHRHAEHQRAGAGHQHHDRDDGTGHAAAEQCNACAAFCCSLTPLASRAPTLAEPVDLAAVSFPDPSSPAPTFVSGGPERPPRSI